MAFHYKFRDVDKRFYVSLLEHCTLENYVGSFLMDGVLGFDVFRDGPFAYVQADESLAMQIDLSEIMGRIAAQESTSIWKIYAQVVQMILLKLITT